MKKRMRYNLCEMYDLDLDGIKERVIKCAYSYMKDGYNKTIAIEISLSDYSFWYNSNIIKKHMLEDCVYNYFNLKEGESDGIKIC